MTLKVGKYRKRPLVLEAVQLDYDNAGEVAEWCGGELIGPGSVAVPTLEGQLPACAGSWIIHGLNREFYICHPVSFAIGYEDADDDELVYAKIGDEPR